MFGKWRCSQCRVKYEDKVVPKWVRMADNSWKKVCSRCNITMGSPHSRTNISQTRTANQRRLF